MLYYFVMNQSGQYLDANSLWTDDWLQAKRTLTIPKYDMKVIGVYEIFQIDEVDLMVVQHGKRPIAYKKVKDVVIPACIPKAMHENFMKAYNDLLVSFTPKPFVPNCRYIDTGDQLEVYLTDDLSYCDPVGVKAPGIMIMRNMQTKEITGVKIQCFLDRIGPPKDPSRKAMIMDLEFVYEICKHYEERITSNASAWTWKDEELQFFRTAIRLWPTLKFKFLQELPSVP